MNRHSIRIPLLIKFIFTVLHSGFICLAGNSVIVPSDGIRTIAQGLARVRSADTVYVEPGVYTEQVSVMSGVTLVSRTLHGAIIDGKGRGDLVTLSHRAAIAGSSSEMDTPAFFHRG